MTSQPFHRRSLLSAAVVAPEAKTPLAIGCDHAGLPLKGPVIELLRSWGHIVEDCGTFSEAPVGFPDIAQKVCAEILGGRAKRGILVCGTGVGAFIAPTRSAGSAPPSAATPTRPINPSSTTT